MTPSPRIRISSSTWPSLRPAHPTGPGTREPRRGASAGARSAAPRQPSTGRSNLRTSVSVNGSVVRAGQQHRRGARGAPRPARRAAASSVRRPSHGQHRLGAARPAPRARPPTTGATTSGRANRACALIGTTSSASTRRPHDRAARGERVGRRAGRASRTTTPSQPQRDSGRPSTSTTTSSIRSRARLLDRRLVERPARADDLAVLSVTVTSSVMRSSTVVVARSRTRSTVSSRSSDSAAARKPTRPRLTPSSGTPAVAGQLGRAQDRAVAAEHEHELGAGGRRAVDRQTRTPVSPTSSASSASTRTSTPASCSRRTTRRAASASRRGRCGRRAGRSGHRRHPVTTVPPRPPAGGRPRPAAARRAQPQEELDVAARAGQRARDDAAHPEPERPRPAPRPRAPRRPAAPGRARRRPTAAARGPPRTAA